MLKLRSLLAAIMFAVVSRMLCVAPASAQSPPPNLPSPGAFQVIPDYTGPNAGRALRNAINSRFSGLQPISPKIASKSFVNLPAEQDGLVTFCRDCQATIPCAQGGPGAWAFGQNGVWTCTAPNVPGNVLYQGQPNVQLNDLSASLNGTLNLKSTPFNAIPDARIGVDGAITAGSHVLTGTGGAYKSSDVGKSIIVGGAGASGAVLQSTITSFTSPSQVTLATAAGTTVTGAGVLWGTDNRGAIQSSVSASLGETVEWLAPGSYMVTCPGSGNPAINLYTFGATLMGASGHAGTDIGQMPGVQILGSGCPIVQVNANGVGVESVLIRDPIGNSATVGLQIGPPNNSSPLSSFTIAKNSIVCQRSSGAKCYMGTGVSAHFALRGMFSDNVVENWAVGVVLGSGNLPGGSESNAIVMIGNKLRENGTGLLVPSGATPDVFSYGNTFEANLYGVDLEGVAIFKDFGSHFENGNPSAPFTAPAVCGGATPAPVEIVNCGSNVETSATGFYGVSGPHPVTSYYGTSSFNSKMEGGPVGPVISGAGLLVLQDLTAGPSSVAPIGSNVGMVVVESGLQTSMMQGGSVYTFRGFPYLDFTGQDSRFKTVTAALSGTDPNNGTYCFGLNCAHYLAEQGGSLIAASDPIYSNFAPQFAGEVNVEGKCLGCAAPAEVDSTKSTITGALVNSALTSGQCVQTSTGGLLTTTGAPCSSGGATSSIPGALTVSNSTTNSVTGSVNFDLSTKIVQTFNQIGNTTATLTGLVAGALASHFYICQDATGSRTLTFTNTIQWSGGTGGGGAPTHTATANRCDDYSFYTPDGTIIRGYFVPNFGT